METKFNFKSQICTDRFQSERLLGLGLKKETADCHWYYSDEKWKMGEGCNSIACENLYPKYYIPAWSLHRLIEMIKDGAIRKDGTDEDLSLDISGDGLYDGTIEAIEWLIKEGYFNKEYLV